MWRRSYGLWLGPIARRAARFKQHALSNRHASGVASTRDLAGPRTRSRTCGHGAHVWVCVYTEPRHERYPMPRSTLGRTYYLPDILGIPQAAERRPVVSLQASGMPCAMDKQATQSSVLE